MQACFVALAFALAAAPALAQTSTPAAPGAAGEARPARGPEQTSTPSNAPAATATQTTGAQDQSAAVKEMNEAEKKKVEALGK